MSKKHKKYNPELKAKVAIEALKNENNLIEICAKNNIPKTNVHEWKEKLIKEAKILFTPSHELDKQTRLLKQEIEELHKIIGEISIENNFLKKKLLK